MRTQLGNLRIFILLLSAAVLISSNIHAMNSVEEEGVPPVTYIPIMLDGLTVIIPIYAPSLPPDPGDPGRQTLGGIDADADGVRDDVERHIALTYPNLPALRQALYQYARVEQAFLLESSSSAKTLQNANSLLASMAAIQTVAPSSMDRLDIITDVHATVLNTIPRSQANINANTIISGTTSYYGPVSNINQCDTNSNKTAVYYVNGMFNDIKAINAVILELVKLLHHTNYEIGFQKQANEPFLTQALQVYEQKQGDDTTFYWKWLANFSAAPDWFRSLALEKAKAASEEFYVNDLELQQHVNAYLQAIALGKKVVVIAHSQGNFYANQAWNRIDDVAHDKIGAFGVVGVASPANYVGGNGFYTTLSQDIVINAVRSLRPVTLPSTNSDFSATLRDIWGHNFIRAYLKSSVASPRIYNHIVQTANTREAYCPPEEEPIPCGEPVFGQGHNEIYEVTQELGSSAGLVPLEFEAYYIPDEIEVRAANSANTLLAQSSGPLSGFHQFNIHFNPENLNTTKVKVKVIGNTNPDTAWNFHLGCPGTTITNNDRVVKRISTRFKFGGNTGTGVSYSCTLDLYIDDVFAGSVAANSGSANYMYRELAAGTHSYRYQNLQCGSFDTGVIVVTYKDSRPEQTLATPTSGVGQNRLFSVQ